jgi:hypothetical protein
MDDYFTKIVYKFYVVYSTYSRFSLIYIMFKLPPMQWAAGVLYLLVNRPGHGTDYSPPSNAEVKDACSCTSTLPIRLHGVVLSEAQRQIYSYVFALFTTDTKKALPVFK